MSQLPIPSHRFHQEPPYTSSSMMRMPGSRILTAPFRFSILKVSLFKPGLGAPLGLIAHTLPPSIFQNRYRTDALFLILVLPGCNLVLVVHDSEQESTLMIAHLLFRSSINRRCAIIRMLFCSVPPYSTVVLGEVLQDWVLYIPS